MQIGDPTAGPVARKGSATDGEGDPARRAGRPGSRFRDTLRQADLGAAGGSEAATAAVMAGWFRGEPAQRAATAPTVAPTARPAEPPKVDRILIADGGGESEARIRIGSGALAGAEIRLTAAPGSPAVAAELLTRTEGSRQTLSVAMDEIRLRLRSKGIALAGSPGRRRGACGLGEPGTNDEGGGLRPGGNGW